jgi:RimJ/RimL family protein N-acetyltransferase
MTVPIVVTLRPVEAGDLPVLFEHQRDRVANELAGVPARDHEAFMAHWERILADEEVLIRAIVAGARLAGNVLSFEREGRREVGYWIARELWGRGIATAALAAFLEVETRRPLYAAVVERNLGSLRVLEKCGFERIGLDGDMVSLVIRGR